MSEHLIPGCEGYAHIDGLCETELGSLDCGSGELVVTVNAGDDQAPEVAVWQEMGSDLLRTRDRAEALAFSAKIRAFADAIEQGANLLPVPVSS